MQNAITSCDYARVILNTKSDTLKLGFTTDVVSTKYGCILTRYDVGVSVAACM